MKMEWIRSYKTCTYLRDKKNRVPHDQWHRGL